MANYHFLSIYFPSMSGENFTNKDQVAAEELEILEQILELRMP